MALLGKAVKFALLMLLVILLPGVLGVAGLYLYLNPSPPPSQAFINGQVLTMNPGREVAEAVFVRGARIAAVGSNEQIAALTEADTIVNDLQGQTLVPGFIDAHGHFPGSGLAAVAVNLNSPPIHDVRDIETLQQRLAAGIPDVPEGRWLLGYGYDDTQLAEGRHPTRQELDAVSRDLPVLAMHVSGHMGVANSAGLRRLGIDRTTPDPEGGEIHRDATGQADGLLLETAFSPARADAIHFTPLQQYRLTAWAVREYLGQGVTTAQNGLALAAHGKSMALASRLGVIPLRLVLWPQLEFARALLSGAIDESQLETDRLSVGAIKLQADGSIQGYTGYLSQPYFVAQNDQQPLDRGYPVLPPARLDALVQEFHLAGRQLAIHANGDASIDLVLDAFAKAQALHPVADPRLVLVHAQMLRSDQIGRLQTLGITPSFFNAHVYYWGDRHRDIFLGPERAAHISPLRSARDAGLRYSLHLDTPVVPMQPMRMLHAAVTRRTAAGEILGPDQRVGALDALAAITIDAAWQIFEDHNRGSIEAGKWADLVVLDGDPLADPQRLPDIQVTQTLVGGVSVYQRQPGF